MFKNKNLVTDYRSATMNLLFASNSNKQEIDVGVSDAG